MTFICELYHVWYVLDEKGVIVFGQNLEITTIVGLVLSLQYSSFVSCTEVEGNPEQAQWQENPILFSKNYDAFGSFKTSEIWPEIPL